MEAFNYKAMRRSRVLGRPELRRNPITVWKRYQHVAGRYYCVQSLNSLPSSISSSSPPLPPPSSSSSSSSLLPHRALQEHVHAVAQDLMIEMRQHRLEGTLEYSALLAMCALVEAQLRAWMKPLLTDKIYTPMQLDSDSGDDVDSNDSFISS